MTPATGITYLFQKNFMAIRKILISQRAPLNETPYVSLKEKYGVDITFRQFFLIEPLTSREFREQKVNLADFTAIVFSSRHAIDAYFRLTEDFPQLAARDAQLRLRCFHSRQPVILQLLRHPLFPSFPIESEELAEDIPVSLGLCRKVEGEPGP